ncbi:mycofactocin-coupled SDR family oxidoreductase [Trujillonella humicola]|uniref:mycofactocin-coupled SDR family oxidoreductase n=1 Tax=Trujillonella humicola TaxID=3383699 RepID=UPI0039068AAB
MGLMDGKVVLVTGAARGQGRSHAIRFAEEGADVVALDRCGPVESVPYPLTEPEDLAETVRAVEALDRRIIARQVDVRDGSAMRSSVVEAAAELGGLDVILANAGVASFSPVREMSDEVWQDNVDINLTGVFHTVRAGLPHLRGGGSIVLTGSTASRRAGANLAHYSAAKHGVVGLMQALAIELGPEGIRVNAVLPTTTDTAMVQNQTMYDLFLPDKDSPGRADLAEVLPQLHLLPVPWVEPVDISNACLFLASPAARYITGVALPVDAGWLAR